MKRRIRVLIVDDSTLVADGLRGLLQADGDIEVVGHALDGQRAVQLVEQLAPDLVTMDIRMPVMDGLEAIEQIMAFAPTPILVVTGDPGGDRLTFEALARGALDLVPKPEVLPRDRGRHELLRRKVRLLAAVPVIQHVAGRRRRRAAERAAVQASRTQARQHLIALCASTGGPHALPRLLAPLPPTFPVPIVLVQHITDGFGEGFARWLDEEIALRVRVAAAGERLEPGSVLVAPDGFHMRVDRAGGVELDEGPPIDGHRPSGDALLESVARAYGERGLGVVLTGMQADGARGLLAIRQAGGRTFAQDEASSIVFGMPKAAIEAGAVEQVLPLHEIAAALTQAIGIPGTPAG